MIQNQFSPPYETRVKLVFWFPTRASDIDGPIKRALDAVEQGIKDAGCDWNDNRITSLVVYKEIGHPRMEVFLDQDV